jgi:hypothetical protein
MFLKELIEIILGYINRAKVLAVSFHFIPSIFRVSLARAADTLM